MIKVTVCIGSSCHIKGSRQVVEELQKIVKEQKLDGKVELSGTFCMGKCSENGVSVTVDGKYFSVKPDEVEVFFNENIMPLL